MKTKQLTVAVIGSLLVGAIIGATFSRVAKTETNNTNPSRMRKFAMNVVVSGVPFWIESKNTWTKLDDLDPGITTIYGGPTNTDSQRQLEELESLISSGDIDGIFLYPGDSKTLTPIINAATDKGISVVTYLTDCPDSKRLTYITSDLDSAGDRVATYALKQKTLQGKAVILYGQSGNDEQEARARGIENAISRTPLIELLTKIEDRFDDAVGAEAMKTILSQHKDIVLISGCNSRSAIGAVQALKELGYKPGQVTVTGWDFDNQVLELIDTGWISCSAAQQSEVMTFIAFNLMRSQASGEFEQLGKSGRSPMPNQIVVPVELVTNANTSKYRRSE